MSTIKDHYTDAAEKAIPVLELHSYLTVIVVSRMKDGYTDVPEKTILELCSYLTVSLLFFYHCINVKSNSDVVFRFL